MKKLKDLFYFRPSHPSIPSSNKAWTGFKKVRSSRHILKVSKTVPRQHKLERLSIIPTMGYATHPPSGNKDIFCAKSNSIFNIYLKRSLIYFPAIMADLVERGVWKLKVFNLNLAESIFVIFRSIKYFYAESQKYAIRPTHHPHNKWDGSLGENTKSRK